MPIVVPAVTCHPSDLLSRLPDEVTGRRWFVACTMPRQEKSLARDLLLRSIPFYLPVLAKRLRYKGRNTKSYLPLFSGFVFLFASDDERAQSLETGRITSLLEVTDQAGLQRDLAQVEESLCRHADYLDGANGNDGANGKRSGAESLTFSVGFLRQNVVLDCNREFGSDSKGSADLRKQKPLSW